MAAKRRVISSETWDAHRELITRLYITEDRTLQNVIATMADMYDFHATSKMFKTRLAQWHLYKNHRKGEVEVVVKNHVEHVISSAGAELTIRGRPLDVDRVKVYLSRRAKRLRRSQAVGCATSSSLVPASPPSSTPARLSSISMPTTYRISEVVFKSLNDYHDGAARSGLWTPDPLDPLFEVVASKPGGDDLNSIYHFLRLNLTAVNLIAMSSFVEARQRLDEAFNLFDRILSAEHPRFLAIFFSTLWHIHVHGRPELLQLILQHGADLADIKFAALRDYPLRNLLRALLAAPAEERGEMISLAWKCTVANIGKTYGRASSLALHSRLHLELLFQPDFLKRVEHQILTLEREDDRHHLMPLAGRVSLRQRWLRPADGRDGITSSPPNTAAGTLKSGSSSPSSEPLQSGSTSRQTSISASSDVAHLLEPSSVDLSPDYETQARLERLERLTEDHLRLGAKQISIGMYETGEEAVRNATWMYLSQWDIHHTRSVNYLTKLKAWLQDLGMGDTLLFVDISELQNEARKGVPQLQTTFSARGFEEAGDENG